MFPNVTKQGSMPHAARQASKRSEKPAVRRRPTDRSPPDATVDVVAKLDRRSPCSLNPNSRMNVPVTSDRPSSHPQGREATMRESCSPSFVGIDVSKRTLDVCIEPSHADQSPQRFSLDNTDQDISALVDRLRAISVGLVIIEATGRYHRRLAATLLMAGIPTKVINPQRSRDFAKSLGKLEKSDPIDAQVLAHFGRAINPQPDVLPKEGLGDLADLVSRRRSLIQIRVAEANRSHDQMPKLAARQCKSLLRMVDQQIEDLDREIAKAIEADDDWHKKSQIIDSVPGIGPDSANQLVIDLPELGQLNRQQIAKLVGVAPLMRDSGRFRGQRTIGGGRHDIRTTLYMLAHNAVMYCPRFKQYFDDLIARGKLYKVAKTACMRKLLITLNQMVKTNTHWKQLDVVEAL
jgi:transposase